MRTSGTYKVVLDAIGAPWLVAGTDDGYEAQRVLVIERHQFRHSYKAVGYVTGAAAVDREVEAVHLQVALDRAREVLAEASAVEIFDEAHSPAWWVGTLQSVLRSVLEAVDEHTPAGPHRDEAA